MARLGCAAVALALALATPFAAHAQASGSAALASAQASFDAADFDGAVRDLTALLERGSLEPDELARAVGLLALASRGAGDDASLERALLLLSTVEGADGVVAAFPPSLRARFDGVGQRPDPVPTVEAGEDEGELVVRAQIEPEIPLTVLRVHGRTGDGEWQHGPTELRLSLEAPAEYYATLDLAGVALRETAHETHAAWRRAIATVPDAALRSEPASSDDSAVWWAVGSLSVAAAIGAAIAIGIVLSQPGATTTVIVGPT